MSREHLVPSSELHALRDLELATRATVEGLRQGLHRSPFHGYSAEFSQYRHYQHGDDLKYVDWKAFARTDRIYTRQFRETTNLGALFVIDISRSMDFPFDSRDSAREVALAQGGPARGSKFALAQSVAAVLGTLVLDQGDGAGVLAVDDRVHLVPPRSGRHHLRLFLAGLGRLQPRGAAGVDVALRQAAMILKRRGLVIVLSDLYDEAAALPEIRRLARMGHDVIVIQTLAGDELTLDVGGAAEFVDLETGRTLLVQPAAVRDSYRAAVRGWVSGIERQIRRDGIDYLRVVTGEPLEPVLRRFLIGRRGGR